ncbi:MULTISPECIES: ABC transporter ATP-binding protein [Staphylococcus]|uniref:ABC transporter ATP-binding protein n=1 Tax=Staphylococcus schleiferi TaxID=1295 RepID=A0ABX0FWR1_STASC|nr:MULTISPECIES: ABC transporter ATP-binding protein [Staphylococcus]QGS46536.1 ATP-binding cassette domain-containing protein [Mammaliicoccus fleurettii]EPD50037.1 hypothetical protein HMPREF1208_01575 [Staphylococcus sp. HGB0015]MBF1992127.1 ABC transporter ATP-binding protein [Staphylococcus schleiferi]MBF2037577.1 ABC transporter ATP-binding protein [Staphylococcus schleiferi]MBF2099479.1 ABC transporter ATP-binding protein [Staphylococcus schleiferi]
MVLKVSNLEKTYRGTVPFTAIDQISMNVEKGEFIAIMGPSGSGKSTFLNTISTIDRPTNGTVEINGINPHKMSDNDLANFRRRELGFVFQQFKLIHTLTIGENIILPLTLDGCDAKTMHLKLQEIASLLDINHILDKRTYEVSGGQAQRAAIARAVINSPAILLADEPTGNLDSKSAKDVMKLFQKLNDTVNVTIIMVTHDPLIASYSDRACIIKDGRIYQEMINKNNALAYKKQILDTMTFLGGDEVDFT